MTTLFPSAVVDLSRLPLTEVIERLSTNEDVLGIVMLGSTGTPLHSEHSDFDLLLVLARLPVPLRVVVTAIAGRMADIILVSSAKMEEIVAGQGSWELDSWAAKCEHWLRTGTIAFDRRGLVSTLQNALTDQSASRQQPLDESSIYRVVAQINYNVVQNERMVQNPAATYQVAVGIRMLYSILELFMAYFALRRLPFRGEKQAVRFLERTDPAYYALLQRCLSSAELSTKVATYRELAGLTLAPVGGLWPAGFTTASLDDNAGDMQAIRTGLAFWDELVRSPTAPDVS